MKTLLVASPGVVPYGRALDIQRDIAKARIGGTLANDVLLLVQHPPVITTGRSTDPRHLLADQATLAARGVELFDVERGGDVTFHGPGQLVGYPIMDLRQHREDLHWYLRQVERALIAALAELGVGSEQRAGLTGVWTNGRKIASIGVHARSWVTWHGFALNVTTDLSAFDLIVPCGIDAVEMTSVEGELGLVGADPTGDLNGPRASVTDPGGPELLARAEAAVVQAFARTFGMKPQAAELTSLLSYAG